MSVLMLLLRCNCRRSTGLRRRVEHLRGGVPSVEEATPSAGEDAPSTEEGTPSAEERGEGGDSGDVILSLFAESVIVEEGSCEEESLLVAFVSLI